MIGTVRTWWDRWKITIVFCGLALSFIFTYYVKTDEANRRIEAACASVTQVKEAAFSLAKPTPEAGVTDPATLARIRISNAAKQAAREQLEQRLSCRR